MRADFANRRYPSDVPGWKPYMRFMTPDEYRAYYRERRRLYRDLHAHRCADCPTTVRGPAERCQRCAAIKREARLRAQPTERGKHRNERRQARP